MTGEVLKSFLVGLGFGVDDASLAKFNKAITSATLKVTALYASTKVAAAGIVYGISKISEGFEQMGYEYKLIAPAINKALILRQEMFKAYSAAGVNITKVVQAAVKLNLSLTKTRYAFEAIYKSVGSRFFDILTKQSDIFRGKIYANMPKIQAVLERMIKFIFKALEATVTLGTRLWSILSRVYDFFAMLDKATDGWSTKILAVVAIWKALNLSFLATPLGMIIAGLIAILALFDDFETWKEGGESLFDWSSFVPVINAVTDALKSLWGVVQAIADVLAGLASTIYQVFTGNFAGALDSLKETGQFVLNLFNKLWDSLKSIIDAGGALGSWASNLLGGGLSNIGTNIGNFVNGTNGTPAASPVGSNVQGSSSNQHVQQQTNINVTGSADASSVGKAVAGEQSKVNFDMVRNMKGATR